MTREIPLPHPGIVLREEFFEPMGVSIYAAAKSMHIPRSRLNEICKGKQSISAAIAVRLGKFLGVDPQWFMNMQSRYDLVSASYRLRDEIEEITPFGQAA